MEKNKDKYNQQFRKTLKILENCEDLMKNTDLSYEAFYVRSIFYEFAYSLSMFYLFKYVGWYDDSISLLFLRRTLECIAYYRPFQNNEFEKINFQIFKIQSQNRNVGSKEAQKIIQALKLKKVKVNSALKGNKFLFLHGIYSNEFTYHNFVEECLKKEGFYDASIYDYLSLRAHQSHPANSNWNFRPIDDLYTDIIIDLIPHTFRQAMKDAKQLHKMNLKKRYEEFTKEDSGFLESVEAFKTMIKVSKSELLRYLYFNLIEIYDYLYLCVFLSKLGLYRGIVSSFKPFIEKISAQDKIFKYKPSEAKEMFDAYGLCSEVVLMDFVPKKYFEDLKSLNNDEEIRKVYTKLVKPKINISFQDFKIAIKSNPSFVLNLKPQSFLNSIEEFAHDSFPSKAERLKKVYLESVVLSHCDGFLLFRKENDYLYDARFILEFTFEYLKSSLNYVFGNQFFSYAKLTDQEAKKLEEEFNKCFDKIESFLYKEVNDKKECEQQEASTKFVIPENVEKYFD